MTLEANADELALAVELQRKSYGLLQWIADAIRKGTFTFTRAHEYGTESDSFREWLVTYSRQVPGRSRPKMGDPREVDMFVNLFASYLATSFELVEEPGLRSVASGWGCHCGLCLRLVAASHLRARKLGAAEKMRARTLKLDYLARLAAASRKSLSPKTAEAILEDSETATPVALATYGEILLERCHGSPGEPAALALWREFAWTPAGSPRRDFELSAELLLQSEARLAQRLAS